MFVEERLLDVVSFSFIYLYHAVKLLTSYTFWLSRLAALLNSKCLSPREVKLIFAASEVHASYTNANLCKSDWVWFY